MVQLNFGGHSSGVADFVPIPTRHHNQITWARDRAIKIARDLPEADRYYRTLPGGRSLTDLLADSSIWVNYNSSGRVYGYTNHVGGTEMTVNELAYRFGRWTVLATLVHELAHVNGAGGEGTAAERAVLACGLGRQSERRTGRDDPRTPYDPTIIGAVPSSRTGFYA